MKEKIGTPKLIDTSKSEHLIPGVKPIIVCIDSRTSITSIVPKLTLSNMRGINYDDSPANWAKNNFLHAGLETYIISTIDDFNKFSEGFFDCTGLVVAGIDKETGKNISFLTHQDPKRFLSITKDKFIEHLKQRLIEIKNRCQPGTIDAVIVGGNYLTGFLNSFRQNYLDSIKLLSLETQQILGFEPVVINGPKLIRNNSGDADNIYYDNQNRRLYFMRQEVNLNTGSFTHSYIDKEKKKWKK